MIPLWHTLPGMGTQVEWSASLTSAATDQRFGGEISPLCVFALAVIATDQCSVHQPDV